MSPLRMWLNSWATTPWSSSRVRESSAPRVTATAASLEVCPAAKALIPASPSRTKTAGTESPEAMDISSTTFRRRSSPSSRVSGSTRRPPSSSATAGPPRASWEVRNAVPPPMRAPIPAVTPRRISGCRVNQLPPGPVTPTPTPGPRGANPSTTRMAMYTMAIIPTTAPRKRTMSPRERRRA
jgi:hypothetical protein